MKKSFKSLLNSGRKFIGTMMQVPSEELAEIMGHAGVEFLVLDMEHCPMSHAKIVSMVRACESVDVVPLVRVPDVTDEDSIKKALDAGAAGVLVPNVSTVEQARKAVEYGKFAPVGKRGACPFVRANWYGGEDCGAYYGKANEETSILLLVEGPEGIKNLPEIMKVEGIDAIHIGAVDLSVSLGIPGQTEHPMVIEAIKKAAELAVENGKTISYFCNRPEEVLVVKDWPGVSYYLCPIPEAIVRDAYVDILKTMRELG